MIATRPPTSVLRCDDGVALPLPVGRWLRDAVPEEHQVLELAVPPVLDVGCGPGRHTLALARRGIAVLGLDPAPTAVRLGRSRGASILQRPGFGRAPGPPQSSDDVGREVGTFRRGERMTEPPPRQSGRAPLAGLAAGLGAGLVLTLATTALRIAAGIPLPVELVSDRVIPSLSIHTFG